MPCRHQFAITASEASRPAGCTRRTGRSRWRDRTRSIGGELLPEVVEHVDGQAARVGRRLHHDRRHGPDEHQLRDSPLAVAGDVPGDLAAAGRVADVDGVAQVELLTTAAASAA